jgi:hypothetical protein
MHAHFLREVRTRGNSATNGINPWIEAVHDDISAINGRNQLD